MLKPTTENLDPLLWATNPRSQTALDYVRRGAAEGNADLKSIIEKLIEDGVCTDKGRLLRQWDGIGWVQVSAAADVEVWV